MTDLRTAAPVAVIGFGNQGTAQALRLRESGVDVIVGARPGGGAEARARSHGFATLPLAEAAQRARVVAILLPDEATPGVWGELADAFAPDVLLVFAHGFNLLYGSLVFPERADVVLVSPTGPGRALAGARADERSLPAYVAVHRDGSGTAWNLAERYAARLGLAPLWRTTVREETEVDLFGEQVVLCGGMNALLRAAFETLVANGYSREMAYLECVHQLKHMADLLHEQGMSGFRAAISGTALYGDLTRGPRVIGESSRREMQAILEEIRSGEFAREWLEEVASGRARLRAEAPEAALDPMEEARRSALRGSEGRDAGRSESRNTMSKR